MKHHFGDMLNRDGDYWTISENRKRWAYRYADVQDAPDTAKKLTLTRDDANWERIFELSNLTELTLHEASKDQLQALKKISGLKALRISHARPKTLEFLESQSDVEELVLEYVSGFDSLAPLQQLPKLKSLHTENIRRVANFGGLSGCDELRSLSIYGTFDWKQPIENVAFLQNIQTLEYFGTWQVRFLSKFPVFGGVNKPRAFKKINIGMSDMTTEDFAYLNANYVDVDGASRSAYRLIESRDEEIHASDIRYKMPMDQFLTIPRSHTNSEGKRFLHRPACALFLGKGTRTYEGPREKVIEKCEAFQSNFDDLVKKYKSK